jgi:peptidoglycan hydrolase-like protein with peptidoglycan-binding domain
MPLKRSGGRRRFPAIALPPELAWMMHLQSTAGNAAASSLLIISREKDDTGAAGTTSPSDLAGLHGNDGMTQATADRRPRVKHLQQRLNEQGAALSIDGKFGSVTAAALNQFQASLQLPEKDGVDPPVAQALEQGPPTGHRALPITQLEGLAFNDGLTFGTWDRRERVKELQRVLEAAGYPPQKGFDGRFGQHTLGALQRFQRVMGLPPTTTVDRPTADALDGRVRQAHAPGTPGALAAAAEAQASPMPRGVRQEFEKNRLTNREAALAVVVDEMRDRRELDARLLVAAPVAGDSRSWCANADFFSVDDTLTDTFVAAAVLCQENCVDHGGLRSPNARIRVGPGAFKDIALLHSQLLHEFRHVKQQADECSVGKTKIPCGYCADPQELDAYLAEVEAGYSPKLIHAAFRMAYVMFKSFTPPGRQAALQSRRDAAQIKVETALGRKPDWDVETAKEKDFCDDNKKKVCAAAGKSGGGSGNP